MVEALREDLVVRVESDALLFKEGSLPFDCGAVAPGPVETTKAQV
jgi:hypothetical protein